MNDPNGGAFLSQSFASNNSNSSKRHQNSLTGFLDPLRREPTKTNNQNNNDEEFELDEFDLPPADSPQAVLGARSGAGFGAQIFPGPTVQGGTHLLSAVLADVVKPEIKSRIYVAVTFRAESGNMSSLFRSMQYINNHYSARAAGGNATASTSLITGFMLVGDDVCCIMLEGDPWIYIDMLSVLNQKTAHYSNPSGFIVDARVIRVQNDIRDTFFKKFIYESLPSPSGGASETIDSSLLQDEVRLGLLFYRRLTDLGRYCSVGIEETWVDLFQNLPKKYPHFYVSPEMVQSLAANPKFMPISLYLQMYMSSSFPHASAICEGDNDKLSGINDLLRARKWSIPIAGLHFGDTGRAAVQASAKTDTAASAAAAAATVATGSAPK